jgi:GxxExxY protein
MSTCLHKDLSYKVMGAVFKVHNYLKGGLLESAYEGALVIEFDRLGLKFERQKVYPLYYEGECAGAYIADLVVEKKIILELKSVKKLHGYMDAQLLSYLRLSGIEVGYLINFHYDRLRYRRLVLSRT